ncbi:hypothetical protein Tco_0396525 [Tanacetum coccineum]
MEVSRLSGMDNDLFTYKVEVSNIPCNSVIDDDLEDELIMIWEYVVVKEDEYDDLIMTRRDACQAYQEIFRIMDEGWMVTRAT